MSQPHQPSQGSLLPDPQTAYNNLFYGIHSEVFFNKCAAYGHVPQTHDDALWMLQTSAQLRAEEERQASCGSRGSDSGSPYYRMKAALDNVLQASGVDVQAPERELAVKGAATRLADDPVFYNSVLSLKAAEAAQAQQYYKELQAQQR